MKKTFTLRLALVATLLSTTIMGYAYDFMAADKYGFTLYCNILDADAMTAEITYDQPHVANYSREITIPETVLSNVDGNRYTVVAIGKYAFERCAELTAVSIPNTVTRIGDQAFLYCEKLKSVNIPDGVTEMGLGVFSGCYVLPNVVLPDGITYLDVCTFEQCWAFTGQYELPSKLTVVEQSMFRGDYQLSSIVIPERVSYIADYAFVCSGLTSIYSLNPTPPTCANSDCFADVSRTDCCLYVPAGSQSKYRSAKVWSEFSNILEIGAAGIEGVSTNEVEVIGYYTLDGKKLNAPQQGINIVRYSDGSSKKIVVK